MSLRKNALEHIMMAGALYLSNIECKDAGLPNSLILAGNFIACLYYSYRSRPPQVAPHQSAFIELLPTIAKAGTLFVGAKVADRILSAVAPSVVSFMNRP